MSHYEYKWVEGRKVTALNNAAREGWRVKLADADGMWLLLERTIK